MCKNILIVCTGNICRSPMAEGILKEKLRGIVMKVSSAGTNTYDGFPASSEGITVSMENSIDISGHLSRSLTENMMRDADVVLTMSTGHMDIIEHLFPDYADKTEMLRLFGSGLKRSSGMDIKDPIGGDINVYRKCFVELREEIERILPLLTEVKK